MLLLDSDTVAVGERVDLVTTLMAEASGSTVVLEPHPEVHARMDLWQLGRTQLFRCESSGMRMRLDERQARRDPSPLVALAVQERSVGRHEQFGDRRVVAAGELMMVDLGAPFDFSWGTRGASRALQLPASELGLPTDVVRSAATRLHTSPLRRLLTTHVVDLFRDADRISADPAAATVGASTVELVRALLLSASAATHPRATHRETLLAQIREYVRQNLRDPDLSAARIARAHHISVRHLYALCEQAEFSLEQWIIGRRLEGAFQELARPDTAQRPISVIALRWGFRDPAHFTRRFRTAYGLTPRDWRSIAREEHRAPRSGPR
jgi:AraC-like DNA-binding protein